jgi:biotin carboxyl carrier protein
MRLEIHGRVYDVDVSESEDGLYTVTVDGTRYEVKLTMGEAQPSDVHGGVTGLARQGMVVAPLPGTVISVETRPGEEVEKGQVLVVLESMKMHVPVMSPTRSVVKAVHVKVGQNVAVNEPILELG